MCVWVCVTFVTEERRDRVCPERHRRHKRGGQRHTEAESGEHRAEVSSRCRWLQTMAESC